MGLRSPRAVLAVALAAALAACGEEELSFCTNISATPGLAPIDGIALVGVETHTAVLSPIRQLCYRRLPDAVRVDLELLRPDSRPLDVTLTEPVYRLPLGDWSTTATFTPVQLGPHHLTADFVPEHGLAQADIWAAEDHSGDRPTVLQAPGADCTHVGRTRFDGLLCATRDEGTLFFRDGALAQSWPKPAYWPDVFEVVDDVVWLHRADVELVRLVDTGTGPLEVTARLSSSIARTSLAAGREALVIGFIEGVRFIRFDGSQLTVESDFNLGTTETPRALAYDPATGAVLYLSLFATKHLGFAPDRSTPPAARSLEPGAGLWTLSGSTVVFNPAEEGGKTVAVPAPGRWALRLNDRGRPMFLHDFDGSEVVVPFSLGGALQFARYKAPAGSEFTEITGGWLHAAGRGAHFFFPLADRP